MQSGVVVVIRVVDEGAVIKQKLTELGVPLLCSIVPGCCYRV